MTWKKLLTFNKRDLIGLACGEHSAWFRLITSNGNEGSVSVEEIQLAKI